LKAQRLKGRSTGYQAKDWSPQFKAPNFAPKANGNMNLLSPGKKEFILQ
jgi:hypothetical protein